VRPLPLGVLDQSPVPDGATGGDALRNTVDLARLAETLGFVRYWLAEHHATPSLAGTTPEVLIGPVAAATERIRVGSGGVMLPYYSPLKVAESFSVLSGLYPGRIDLGIGRAPGTDTQTMLALQRDRRQLPLNDFPEQLAELLAYLGDRFPRGHPLARLTALPGLPAAPDVWLLGSSADSAEWAAEAGLPYAFADFINPFGAEFAHTYRRLFRAPDIEPRVAVAVSILCAETVDEAEYLAASWRASFAMMIRGTPIRVPPPDRALELLEELGLDPRLPPPGRRAVVGDRERVRAELEGVVEEYGADEVIAVTITHDHRARRRSYELLAEAMR
jgi:luciferase family oxidoreductase group 1